MPTAKQRAAARATERNDIIVQGPDGTTHWFVGTGGQLDSLCGVKPNALWISNVKRTYANTCDRCAELRAEAGDALHDPAYVEEMPKRILHDACLDHVAVEIRALTLAQERFNALAASAHWSAFAVRLDGVDHQFESLESLADALIERAHGG
jgi:hypothetical protein